MDGGKFTESARAGDGVFGATRLILSPQCFPPAGGGRGTGSHSGKINIAGVKPPPPPPHSVFKFVTLCMFVREVNSAL